MKVTGTIHGPHGFSAALELTPTGAKVVCSGAGPDTGQAMHDALSAHFPGYSIEIIATNTSQGWITLGIATARKEINRDRQKSKVCGI